MPIQPRAIIGLSGYARSGKDTICREIKEHFAGVFDEVRAFSFAYRLKEDLDPFLVSKTGISAFTEDSEKKKIIRPILIEYGCVQRNLTRGRYWVDLVKAEVEAFFDSDPKKSKLAIVTDVRFKEFEDDETDFILSYPLASLIAITRIGNPPAHETERENFERIREVSSHRFVWSTVPENRMKAEIAPLVKHLHQSYATRNLCPLSSRGI